MTSEQHYKLWQYYISRRRALAPTIKGEPIHRIENYHELFQKALAHKRAYEYLRAEARNPVLVREMSEYFASMAA